MYSTQRAEDIREPMNLKPTVVLNLFADESRAIAGHDINTGTQSRESASCGMMSSQAHAMAGRADHQYLFSPSVGVWEKIHFYGLYRSNHFFPLQRYERVNRHCVLPMKVQAPSVHLSNHLLK
ncbi:hypothetical protein TNCV_371341 [Trichonephila clavipes]|nr:hypothetical protein TNCV_371341 [Trichonephila clavipes]